MLNKNVIFYQTDLSQKIIMIQVLQFMIALYFICSFTLRFAFTSFSVEKKTRWILGSAPLNFKKIFLSKYFFYTLVFLILGMVMGYASVVAMNIPLIQALNLFTLFLVTTIGVVTLGTTLGALYPSFETDDPEVISTSMPGLFFTGLSLSYSALSAYVLYLIISKGLLILLGIHALVTLFVVFLLLRKVLTTAHLHYAE